MKSADQDGQEMPASSLRATFTYGSLVLRNLELNLDPILQGLPVRVRRAFARELRIEIPWASLGYQPVEVMIPAVEPWLSAFDPCGVSCQRPGAA